MTTHQRKPGEMCRAATTEIVICHYVQIKGFSCYIKIEHSYETIPKLKLYKVKKQLP